MIYIGGDKHGYRVIQFVEEYLQEHNVPFVNRGVTKEGEDIPLEELIPKVTKQCRKAKIIKASSPAGQASALKWEPTSLAASAPAWQ